MNSLSLKDCQLDANKTKNLSSLSKSDNFVIIPTVDQKTLSKSTKSTISTPKQLEEYSAENPSSRLIDLYHSIEYGATEFSKDFLGKI